MVFQNLLLEITRLSLEDKDAKDAKIESRKTLIL